MNPLAHATSRLARFVAVAALLGAIAAVNAAPVAADCEGPLPSFRKATSTAERVVVGEVIGVEPTPLSPTIVEGRSSGFTLRVVRILRGDAPAIMEIRDLRTQPCAPVASARTGDRIALAFDALDFEPPRRVNTIAWIRGTPPDYMGVETITLREIVSLVGLPATDTETRVPDSQGSPRAMMLLLIAALTSVALAWRAFAAVSVRLGRDE